MEENNRKLNDEDLEAVSGGYLKGTDGATLSAAIGIPGVALSTVKDEDILKEMK